MYDEPKPISHPVTKEELSMLSCIKFTEIMHKDWEASMQPNDTVVYQKRWVKVLMHVRQMVDPGGGTTNSRCQFLTFIKDFEVLSFL